MIVFGDTWEETVNENDFVKLATAGRHKYVHVIYVNITHFSKVKNHVQKV